jgi:hypothetical protein
MEDDIIKRLPSGSHLAEGRGRDPGCDRAPIASPEFDGSEAIGALRLEKGRCEPTRAELV